jgi:hypothetical protein
MKGGLHPPRAPPHAAPTHTPAPSHHLITLYTPLCITHAGLFKQAITAGKRVRSETSISTGSVSVSSAAAELAQLKLPTRKFDDAKITIIGAGEGEKEEDAPAAFSQPRISASDR